MIYFYDGSRAAFLTAFVLSYGDRDAVLVSGQKQLSLGQETVFVRADPLCAARAAKRLTSYDSRCIDDLDLLLRSGEAERDRIALRYLRLIAANKRPVREMLAEDDARTASECIRRVTYEIHRFHGFLRFMESASGALYGPICPDHDISDLLLPHFCARLSGYPFVIHDVRRKKAAVYDGSHTFTAPLERAEIVLSADEASWQTLWKNYFRDVNIPQRERLKQQRGYLPVRYRKFMPEF